MGKGGGGGGRMGFFWEGEEEGTRRPPLRHQNFLLQSVVGQNNVFDLRSARMSSFQVGSRDYY